MAIVLHHSRATGAPKTILLGIANHDGDGGAWPAIGTLAIYGGVTERNAQKAVQRLSELGEVFVSVNGGGSRQTAAHMRTNLYSILLKCPPNCDGTKAHRMMCTVCGKELPVSRRRDLTHRACHPLSLPTPPVASDTGGVSVATPEPNPEPPTTLNPSTHLLNREETELDGSAAVSDAADAILCPKRILAPHAFTKGGECIDCGALSPAITSITESTK